MSKGIWTGIFCFVLLAGLSAQQAESKADTLTAEAASGINSVRTHELMPVFNPWLISSNPAGLIFNPELQTGRLHLSYHNSEGDYKRAQEGNELQRFSGSTDSYRKLGKSWVHGGFSYNKSFEKGCNYTLLNDPYRGSPYLLIDTMARNDIYDREYFSFEGELATPLTPWLTWGAGVAMKTGLSSQDRDPRPRNKVVNLDLASGLVLGKEKLSLGVNFLYAYYNEDIEVDIVEENTQHAFFQLHGFERHYSHVAASFNRLYKRSTWGGAAQLSYQGSMLKLVAGGDYRVLEETADDGRKAANASWSYLKNDSELEGSSLKLFTAGSLQHGRFIHHLDADWSRRYLLGTEILQRLEQVGEAGAVDWVDYGRVEKYASMQDKLQLSYHFLLMKDARRPSLQFELGLEDAIFAQEYSQPDRHESFRNRIYSASLMKSFYTGRHEFHLEAGIRSKRNLNEEADFDEESFLTQILHAPDHRYLSSDYHAPRAGIRYAFHPGRLFETINAGVDLEVLRSADDLERTIIMINTGVTF